MKAIFPGSFNPFTTGHLDILQRALRLFGQVTIAIGHNENKTCSHEAEAIANHLHTLFDSTPGIEIITYTGLTVEAARHIGATVIVRGIRNAADADYERQLADTNRLIAPDIDTILLPARPDLACISSSMVRELSHNNYDVTPFLP